MELIVVNELVGCMAASMLGIPNLQPCTVEVDGVLWFGRDLVPPDRCRVFGVTDHTFDQVVEAEDFCYRTICLDAWLLNPDRHDGNIILRSDGGKPAAWTAYPIDFGKAMASELDEQFGIARLENFSTDIDSWVDHSTAWVHPSATWPQRFRCWESLVAVASDLAALPAESVSALVDAVPAQWASPRYRDVLKTFLLTRKARIIDILERHRLHLRWP